MKKDEIEVFDNYKVVKHNDLINEKPEEPYSLNQLKLICHLISHIKPTDTNFETKKVLIKELGFNSIEHGSNYGKITSEFLQLLKKPFQIPNDGGYANWFSYMKYSEGVIEYAFDERLKPFLLNLKDNFNSYQLKNILSLKSVYSIRMYELLNQYKVIGKRNIELKELRELLNISRGYKNNDIAKLLDNIKEELTLKTDLTFDYKAIKEIREFKSFEFEIKYNKKNRQVNSISLKDKLKNIKIED